MRASTSAGRLTGSHTAGDSAEAPAGGCDIRITAWCLPPATAVRRARSLLRSHLTGHVTDAAVLDDLEIMVGELATNAYRHAGGICEMRVLHHAGVPVVCEIADGGDGLEPIAEHLHRQTGPVDADTTTSIDALTDSGRGLGIVAHLSGGCCGAHSTRLCGTGQIGKSVWFAIPVEHASLEGHRDPRVDARGPSATPLPIPLVRDGPRGPRHHRGNSGPTGR